MNSEIRPRHYVILGFILLIIMLGWDDEPTTTTQPAATGMPVGSCRGYSGMIANGCSQGWLPAEKEADGTPSIDQPIVNRWDMSWNPDDERFYVSYSKDGVAAATFKEWRNAVYWAKTHDVFKETHDVRSGDEAF